jgi:chorismate mutase
VRSAAQYKPTRDAVVVHWRIEDVVAKAASHVEAIGDNPDPIARMYRQIIDISIGEEAKQWDTNAAEDTP